MSRWCERDCRRAFRNESSTLSPQGSNNRRRPLPRRRRPLRRNDRGRASLGGGYSVWYWKRLRCSLLRFSPDRNNRGLKPTSPKIDNMRVGSLKTRFLAHEIGVIVRANTDLRAFCYSFGAANDCLLIRTRGRIGKAFKGTAQIPFLKT